MNDTSKLSGSVLSPSLSLFSPCLSVYMSVCLFVCLSHCLSVCSCICRKSHFEKEQKTDRQTYTDIPNDRMGKDKYTGRQAYLQTPKETHADRHAQIDTYKHTGRQTDIHTSIPKLNL